MASPRRVVAVIPARLASSRFPGKVLADATGRPLLQHVHEAVARCGVLDEIIVATDHDDVRRAAEAFGARVVMTRADHPNGTSRIAEALGATASDPPIDADLIVNVQGDEPEIEPAVVEAAVDALVRDDGASVGTVATPIDGPDELASHAVVKLVRDRRGRALYFSRAPIPHVRDAGGPDEHARPLRHVGLYVYRRAALEAYPRLEPTPLERAEALEQLRWLEHGHAIAVGIGPPSPPGIDTPAQYAAFVERWNARTSGDARAR